MHAGKALDAWVARHVLGWEEREGKWYEPGSGTPVELSPFSTDLPTAWKLAEKICDRGFRLQLDGSRIWQARFYKSAAHTLETQAIAGTGRGPAEAICLAALALHGIDSASLSAGDARPSKNKRVSERKLDKEKGSA